MCYIAEESDVNNTVLDFMKFCDFIETEKPFATQKGDLGVKACYEVNKLLRYPDKNAKPTQFNAFAAPQSVLERIKYGFHNDLRLYLGDIHSFSYTVYYILLNHDESPAISKY